MLAPAWQACRPTVPELRLTPGDVGANLVVATVSRAGTIDLHDNADSADVVVDVTGWRS